MDHEFPDFPEHSPAGKVWRDLVDRVRALEEVNELLLDYIEADLSAPWEMPAKRLAAKLKELRKCL
jgi:hypothetical protein